jgi:hypothetical protein
MCKRDDEKPHIAEIKMVDCLDSNSNRVGPGGTFTFGGGWWRCSFNSTTNEAKKKVYACRGPNDIVVENGTKEHEAGFSVGCNIDLKEKVLRRQVGCSEGGYQIMLDGALKMECVSEYRSYRERSIHPKLVGCVKNDGTIADDGDTFYERNKEGVTILKTCSAREFYNYTDGDYQFSGDITALSCKIGRETLRVGCFANLMRGDAVAYCRNRMHGDKSDAEVGIMPDTGAHIQFLMTVYDLERCGSGIRLGPNQIPGHRSAQFPTLRPTTTTTTTRPTTTTRSTRPPIPAVYTKKILKESEAYQGKRTKSGAFNAGSYLMVGLGTVLVYLNA